MKFLLKIIFILLIFSSTGFNQTKDYFPKLLSKDIKSGKIIGESIYDGSALWGYIDGGADIYLEYGFDRVLLQEIEWKNNKFRVEYYRMKDAAAAFGIFSVSRFKCDKQDTLTEFICITPFQVQSALGQFYISLSNEKGNKETEDFTVELFSKILSKSKEIEFALPEYFYNQSMQRYKNNIKYFRGKLGIQNGYPSWLDLFEEFSNYEIFLMPVEKVSGYTNTALIKFQNKNDLQKFLLSKEKKKGKGIFYKIKQISNKEIIFIETGN